MAALKYVETHNLVAFMEKYADSEDFDQIIDFLNASSIRYALTVNPTIFVSHIDQFWSTSVIKKNNGQTKIYALIDGRKIKLLVNQLDGLSTNHRKYVVPCHTQKIFANMKRANKEFSHNITPLFPTMVVQAQAPTVTITPTPTPTPTPATTSTQPSQPQKQRVSRPARRETEPTEVV
ncbi:hypothetical protein Tco_1161155 [Tanacetum coccineum]